MAQAVDQYCDDLEKLNMSDCPADFRVAYREHMRAWREVGAAYRELPDTFTEGSSKDWKTISKVNPTKERLASSPTPMLRKPGQT